MGKGQSKQSRNQAQHVASQSLDYLATNKDLAVRFLAVCERGTNFEMVAHSAAAMIDQLIVRPLRPTGRIFITQNLMRVLLDSKYCNALGEFITKSLLYMERVFNKPLNILIHRKQWKLMAECTTITLILTNKDIEVFLDSALYRHDVDPKFKELMKSIADTEQPDDLKGSLERAIVQDKKDTLGKLLKSLRISLLYLVSLRHSSIPRSMTTFLIINRLEMTLFILYVKMLILAPADILVEASTWHLTANATIGNFFLAMAKHLNLSSLFDIAIVFLHLIVYKAQPNLLKIAPLPTQIFQSLPIIKQKHVLAQMCAITLLGLRIPPVGTNPAHRPMQVNRIVALQLVRILIQTSAPDSLSYQIIEQLCDNVRGNQLERAVLFSIASEIVSRKYPSTAWLRHFVELAKADFEIKIPARDMVRYQMMQQKNKANTIDQQAISEEDQENEASQNYKGSNFSKINRASEILNLGLQKSNKIMVSPFEILSHLEINRDSLKDDLEHAATKFLYFVCSTHLQPTTYAKDIVQLKPVSTQQLKQVPVQHTKPEMASMANSILDSRAMVSDIQIWRGILPGILMEVETVNRESSSDMRGPFMNRGVEEEGSN